MSIGFFGGQMDYHHHARFTMRGREHYAVLCEAAAEHGLSRQSAGKWVGIFASRDAGGLRDRSSRPQRLRQDTSPEFIARVELLRRERWTGQRIAQQTA